MNDELRINKVYEVVPRKAPLDAKKKKRKREQKQRDETGTHFQNLAEAAEIAHAALERSNSPYRFCVYQKEGEVFIDVVVVGEDGKVKEVRKKNITHGEFSTWLNHIEEGDGLCLDITA